MKLVTGNRGISMKYQNRVLKLSDSCNIFSQAREILFRRCLYSSILYLGGSFANSHKNRFDKFTYVYSFISFLFHWQNTHFFQTQINSQHLKVHNIISFVKTLREKKNKNWSIPSAPATYFPIPGGNEVFRFPTTRNTFSFRKEISQCDKSKPFFSLSKTYHFLMAGVKNGCRLQTATTLAEVIRMGWVFLFVCL